MKTVTRKYYGALDYAEETQEQNHSIELSTNAKGKIQPTIKVYFSDGGDQKALKLLKLLDVCIRQDYAGRLAGEE